MSGVVDFTYSHYQSKIGNSTTSDYTFIEHAAGYLQGNLYDPRFLLFNGGIGYTRTYSKIQADNAALNYDLTLNFFPYRMVSWDLTGSSTLQHYEAGGNIGGYDVQSTMYGGALNLRLSQLRNGLGNNNRNRNTNSNNNDGGNGGNGGNGNNLNNRHRFFVPLPDLNLSYYHSEAESMSSFIPQKETRDNSRAILLYQINSSFNLTGDVTKEKYENALNGSKYDTTTVNLEANARVASNGNLKITNRSYDRDLTGYYYLSSGQTGTAIGTAAGRKDKSDDWFAKLEFQPKDRISHYYIASYNRIETNGWVYRNSGGDAFVNYAYLPELTFSGNAGYRQYEYAYAGSTTQASGTDSLSSTTLGVGAQYQKVFSPERLDPFSLLTGYRVFLGYSDVSNASSSTSASYGSTGSGFYYTNAIDLGLHSTRWKYESLNFDYTYFSRRDYSLLNADELTQTSRASLMTTRVPKANINANMYYITSNIDNGARFPAVLSASSANLQSDTRSLGYGANVDYLPTAYLSFSAGASQGRSTTSTIYTLATVTSNFETREKLLFAGVNVNYGLAQNLVGRASLREERRNVVSGPYVDKTTDLLMLGLDYRLRLIFVTADYRWQKDRYKGSLNVEQQLFYLKVTRPF